MSSEKYSIFGDNKINLSGIFRKWMIRLKINFTTGNERGIDNSVLDGGCKIEHFQGFRIQKFILWRYYRPPEPLPKTSRPASGL